MGSNKDSIACIVAGHKMGSDHHIAINQYQDNRIALINGVHNNKYSFLSIGLLLF